MTLRITVLGFSGSYPAPDRPCSGYLVETNDCRLWVDCGPGTMSVLQNHVDLLDLDAILVTHHHPDHFAELPILYNTYKWYLKRVGVPVYGPASVRTMADVMTGHATADVFDWHIVEDRDHVAIDGIDVAFSRTDHTIENLAMRFTFDGRSLVYTGDTGPDWDLPAFSWEADLLVGEATCLARQHHSELPHLSAEQLGRRAAAAHAARLLPTHVMPQNDLEEHVDEARKHFGGPTDSPEIGRCYIV